MSQIKITSAHDPTRRMIVAALVGLLLRESMTKASTKDERRIASSILVAYFSRTGNTRVVAGLIHRALNTDLFEIRPATPYPEDYLATVEQARQERDQGLEPAIEAKLGNIAAYRTVYLGFPIWGETTPPVIRSFMKAHDLSGKDVIPFVTHGGYGIGSSQSVLASHAPTARIHPAFSMQADQERDTMNRVTDWLSENKARA